MSKEKPNTLHTKRQKNFMLLIYIYVHVNSAQTQYIQKFEILHYLSTPLISEHRLALSIPGNMS